MSAQRRGPFLDTATALPSLVFSRSMPFIGNINVTRGVLKINKFTVIIADLDSPDNPETREGHSLKQSQLSQFFGGIE
jgi:hypothetical protein